MRDETQTYRPVAGVMGAVDRLDSPSARILELAETKPIATKGKLNAGTTRAMWRDLYGHYLRELDIQSNARREMALDEAYYDGDQWSGVDAAILEERGQEALVFNVISQSINWILGTERRGRTDFKILPRRKEGSAAAERKSELLKYLADVNRSEFSNSRAFADCVKAGIGWLESGVQDDMDGEPIYDRWENWRSIVWDSAAQEMDLEDGRYMFRPKWVDLDYAIALFPDRREILEKAASTGQESGAFMDAHGDEPMDSMEEFREGTSGTGSRGYDDQYGAGNRRRVRLIEAWFKKPQEEKRLRGGDFKGELFDKGSIGHHLSVQRGEAEVVTRVTQRMHVMIFCASGPLWFSTSPYRHNRFPFTPIWAYRRSSDGMPYGVIRGMRGAQKDINKRFSKALAIISSNKVIMDEGAVDDIEEFAEEVSRPNPIIVKKTGKHLEIDSDRELAASHLQVLEMSRGMIQSLSGVTDESMGRTTNATSGKAITARQEQGALATAPIFDNLRFARQVHGEKMLSLTEQFMTERKQFRITNKRGVATFVTINDDLPQNDIIRAKADFIISEDDWNATLRAAAVDALLDLAAKLAPVAPDMVLALMDLIVESMDVPSRDEIVKRIRQITGQEDPDADPNTPDPERDAREAAKAEAAAHQKRVADAELRKLEGEADGAQAKAAHTGATIRRLFADLPGNDLAQKKAALELAMQMIAAEPALDVADALHQQAKAEGAPPDPAPPQAPPMPQQPQQPPMPQEGPIL